MCPVMVRNLLKFGPAMPIPPSMEKEPIRMVCPWRLLDPTGFQETLGEFQDELVGNDLEAQDAVWYSATIGAVDSTAPEPSPRFLEELRAMKQVRRRLESIWRKAPTVAN